MKTCDVADFVSYIPEMELEKPAEFEWRSDALAHVLKSQGVPDADAEAIARSIGNELGWNVRVGGVRLGRFVVPDDDIKLGATIAKLVTPQALTPLLEKIPVIGASAGLITAAASAGVLVYRAYKGGVIVSEDEARILMAIERARLAKTAIPKPSTDEIVVWIRTLFGISASADDVSIILDGLTNRSSNDGRTRALVERHDGAPVRWTTSIATWW